MRDARSGLLTRVGRKEVGDPQLHIAHGFVADRERGKPADPGGKRIAGNADHMAGCRHAVLAWNHTERPRLVQRNRRQRRTGIKHCEYPPAVDDDIAANDGTLRIEALKFRNRVGVAPISQLVGGAALRPQETYDAVCEIKFGGEIREEVLTQYHGGHIDHLTVRRFKRSAEGSQIQMLTGEGAHLKMFDDRAENARFTSYAPRAYACAGVERQTQLCCRVLPYGRPRPARIDQDLNVLAVDCAVHYWSVVHNTDGDFGNLTYPAGAEGGRHKGHAQQRYADPSQYFHCFILSGCYDPPILART